MEFDTNSVRRVWRRLAAGAVLILGAAPPVRAQGAVHVGPVVDLPINGIQPRQLISAAPPDDSLHLMLCTFDVDAPHGNYPSSLYTSSDRGRSWRLAMRDTAARWESKWYSEVTCAAGPAGQFYYASGASHSRGLGRGHEFGVDRLYHSADAGATWDEPTILPFLDWGMLAVDGTSGPHRGTLYLFANQLMDGKGHDVAPGKVLLVSTDSGRHFGAPIYAHDPPGALRGFPATATVLPDGRPVAFFETKNRHANRRSVDFLGHVVTIAPAGGGPLLETAFLWNPGDSVTAGTWLERTFGVDTSRGPHRGRMYRASADTRRGTVTIVVWHSDDEGGHWVRAALGDTIVPSRGWASPTLAVSPSGVVGVLWYADANDRCAVFAASGDGGEHFGVPTPLERCAPIDAPPSLTPLREHLTSLPVISERDTTGAVAIRLDTPPLPIDELGVDAAGTFHPFWLAYDRAGGTVVRTATVAVDARALRADRARRAPARDRRPAAPSPATLTDTSPATSTRWRADRPSEPGTDTTTPAGLAPALVYLDPVAVGYDSATGVVSLTLRVTNRGATWLVPPLKARLAALSSGWGPVTLIGADVGQTTRGLGALLDWSTALPPNGVAPADASAPVEIRFRLDHPLRPADAWAAIRGGHFDTVVSARFDLFAPSQQ